MSGSKLDNDYELNLKLKEEIFGQKLVKKIDAFLNGHQ